MKTNLIRNFLWLSLFMTCLISCDTDATSEPKDTIPSVVEPSQNYDNSTTVVEAESFTGNTNSTWRKVKSWKGAGLKKTEPFAITKQPWRIIYNLNSTDYYESNVIVITVMKAVTNEIESVGVNVAGVKKLTDTAYVYSAGQFYLDINPYLLNWTVTVEEVQ